MTQGSQSLHLSGSKVSTNAALDVNATNALQHMKQEVVRLQAENKKLVDQLNVFVSLVQRSWKGDRHATVHLSNIIGLDPPKAAPNTGNDGSQARPNSQMNVKTRCEEMWERLTLKLLEREYNIVQQEIQEYQQRYIQNRQAYMDAVLQDHQQTMSVIPLSRQPGSQPVESVDTRFINHNKAMKRMGIGQSPKRRAQSAKIRTHTAAKDQVKGMDISLKDLVGDVPSSNHFVDSEAFTGERTITAFQNRRQRPQTSHVCHAPNTYNDPSRYGQGDLYDVKEGDGMKKQRPVNASSLREGDAIRSRPHSGSAGRGDRSGPSNFTFLTQRNERSLKYESTKPVYVHPKQSKNRRHSADGQVSRLTRSNSHPGLISQMDVIHASSAAKTHATNQQVSAEVNNGTGGVDTDNDADDSTNPFVETKPPILIRVKSAHSRRPAHIDKFADEERALRKMEADFKKTAITLQKKLGIEDTGIIMLD